MNGERLAELRRAKGITQEDLANYVNLSLSSIKKYEQGKIEPDDSTKKKIAIYFNISCDYLLDLTDQKAPLDRDYIDAISHELSSENMNSVKKFSAYLLSEQKRDQIEG